MNVLQIHARMVEGAPTLWTTIFAAVRQVGKEKIVQQVSLSI